MLEPDRLRFGPLCKLGGILFEWHQGLPYGGEMHCAQNLRGFRKIWVVSSHSAEFRPSCFAAGYEAS